MIHRSALGSTGQTPDAKRPTAWSVQGVPGHLSKRLRDNGVDGEFLAGLSYDDLVTELGATPLQARKIKARFPCN